MIKISDIIDFNKLKNMAKDKDVDQFEEYIYGLYFSMAQGNLTLPELGRKIQTYMNENNISQEKFMNMQEKLMERYGIDMNNIDDEFKKCGFDFPELGVKGDKYENMRKSISFREKYGSKLEGRPMITYNISNSKNNVNIILDDKNVILQSYSDIDLNDTELNEFLVSYKKLKDDRKLNITICKNSSTYLY